jgi:hypothetical protein
MQTAHRNDFMKELNIKPGPKVGEILEELFEQVVEKKDIEKENMHNPNIIFIIIVPANVIISAMSFMLQKRSLKKVC